MNCIREFPSIKKNYIELREKLNFLCCQINEKGFDVDTPLVRIAENEEITKTINKIKDIKSNVQLFTSLSVLTNEGKSLLKTANKKLERENNPYFTAKKGTLNEVFSDCFTAMNYLKLEIGLLSIGKTLGDVDRAKALSKNAINSIPATSSNDSVIFSSALAIAKAEGIVLHNTKVK